MIVHVPTASIVTKLPATEQLAVVADEKPTERLEVVVAEIAKVAALNARSEIGAKVMA